MSSNLNKEWAQVRENLTKNSARYSEPQKVIQLFDLCANSAILNKLIIQISLSRLILCRYIGDVGYPCLYATKDKYVVSNFISNEKYFFTDLDELRSFVEKLIQTIEVVA